MILENVIYTTLAQKPREYRYIIEYINEYIPKFNTSIHTKGIKSLPILNSWKYGISMIVCLWCMVEIERRNFKTHLLWSCER